MPLMSDVEAGFCRSAPWRSFARHVIMPWADRHAVPGPQALEIGAGSGAMAHEMLRRHPEVRSLCVVDADPAMVDAARDRLAPFGERATGQVADATRLPFGPASFDAVCSWLMLHHTLDAGAVLAEAARVLRPGGRLLGYDLADTPVARALHRASRSEVSFLTPDHVEQQLHAAGFADIAVSTAAAGHLVRFDARTPQRGGRS